MAGREILNIPIPKKVGEEQGHWIGDIMFNQKALGKITVGVGHTPTISTKHFLIIFTWICSRSKVGKHIKICP